MKKVTILQAVWFSKIHSTEKSRYVIGINENDCKQTMKLYFSDFTRPEYINYIRKGVVDIVDIGFQGREQLETFLNISFEGNPIFSNALRC